MEKRSSVVILGISNPRWTDLSSSIDDGSGEIDISLIPTPCPLTLTCPVITRMRIKNRRIFRLTAHFPPPGAPTPEEEFTDLFCTVFIVYLLGYFVVFFFSLNYPLGKENFTIIG
jgi:hypothetical protein